MIHWRQCSDVRCMRSLASAKVIGAGSGDQERATKWQSPSTIRVRALMPRRSIPGRRSVVIRS